MTLRTGIRRWCFTGIAILLLAACHSSGLVSAAPETIGVITGVSGSPTLIRASRQYLVDGGSRIYAGDILMTDTNSRARLQMVDQATLTIAGDSHLIFHQYDYDPKRPSVTAHITLTRGAIRARTAIRDSNGKSLFEIRTPVATILLQKGECWGGFSRGSANTLEIAMLDDGELTVVNDHGTTRVAGIGSGTTVIGGAGPQPAQRWSQRKIDSAIIETGLSALTPGRSP